MPLEAARRSDVRRSGNMIRLWTMPFCRLTAKAISSVKPSGAGQVSGLRIQTPSQPFGQKQPQPRIDPARKAKILLWLTNENRDLDARKPQPPNTQENGGVKVGVFRVACARSAGARESFDQRVERIRAPILANEDPDPGTLALLADRGQAFDDVGRRFQTRQ